MMKLKEILAAVVVYIMLVLAICFFTVCGLLGIEVDE